MKKNNKKVAINYNEEEDIDDEEEEEEKSESYEVCDKDKVAYQDIMDNLKEFKGSKTHHIITRGAMSIKHEFCVTWTYQNYSRYLYYFGLNTTASIKQLSAAQLDLFTIHPINLNRFLDLLNRFADDVDIEFSDPLAKQISLQTYLNKKNHQKSQIKKKNKCQTKEEFYNDVIEQMMNSNKLVDIENKFFKEKNITNIRLLAFKFDELNELEKRIRKSEQRKK
jgi:hypothetical protein